MLEKEKPDYILLDLRLPEEDGLKVLEYIKKLNYKIPVIVVTAYGTIESAVSAIKKGAYDYLTKPFDPEELVIIIERIRKDKEKEEREKAFRELTLKEIEIVGTSSEFLKALNLAKKIAKEDTTVLLIGESGTGKEVFARMIHKESRRREGPFITVNCAAIPGELLENELFGSEKGAFTGAYKTKLGKFELADGGTLFLDEIAELPLELQSKLLRAIEYKEIERLGGVRAIKVDTRIIAATNRDIKKMVQEGSFREDLYYRIAVFPIYLPPLRDRKEDILVLAESFLKKLERKLGKKLGLSEEAKKMLLGYDYPGNVRELENILERASIIAENEILPEHLLITEFEKRESESFPEGLREYMERKIEEIEKEVYIKALLISKGNISEASKLLGVSRKTFYEKMKKYNIRLENFDKKKL